MISYASAGCRPRRVPAPPGRLAQTPPPMALTEWPPDSPRLRAGRWLVVGGTAALLAGLALRLA